MNHGYLLESVPCLICQKSFLPYTSKTKYCSEECRNRKKAGPLHLRPMLDCKWCGKQFRKRGKNKVYCSSECLNNSRNHQRKLASERHTKVCLICSKVFEAYSVKFKFCSPDCRKESDVRRKRDKPKYIQSQCPKKKAKNRSTLVFRLKSHYGISIEAYDQMLIEQNFKCAICPKVLDLGRQTHLDHDHTGEKKVRGILCGGCNKGLGHFNDNPDILDSAAAYLRKHNK